MRLGQLIQALQQLQLAHGGQVEVFVGGKGKDIAWKPGSIEATQRIDGDGDMCSPQIIIRPVR